MRGPERHAAAHQPLGDVGGQGVAGRGQLRHPLDIEDQSGNQTGHGRQHQFELGHRIENRFLILLQITVVGQRLRFERGQQAREVADQPAGLAAGQFGDIRIFLLRHDRTSARPRVMQSDIAEFRCAPKNYVLGQPRDIHGDHGQHEGGLGGEVPRGRGVDRIVRGCGETQIRGDSVGIQTQRGPGQRTGTVRRYRGPIVEVGDPIHIAQQRVHMRQQMMGQQHRLGGLQVCFAGHDRARVRGRLGGERFDDGEDTVGHPAHGVAQPHPEQCGHLIIARPSGPKPATDIRSDPVDESAFQCAVHILVGDDREETAVGDIRTQAVQPGQQRVTLIVGQQPRAVQHQRVRLGRDDVIGRQHPVEVGGLTQRRQCRGGPVGEAATPQRALVGGHVCSPRISPRADSSARISLAAAIFDDRPCRCTNPLAAD